MQDSPQPVELRQEQFSFSGLGEIYSYTVVLDPPESFQEQAPYVLALVKLDEGPLITAQITDLDEQAIAIGDRVEMVTRKLTTEGQRGMIVYGYKFRKILPRQ
ncbi:MAG: Zn-ribbon domain-containing OB-fold protein [Chitinophagaceae bacterium]|nr:Zn-ribbon domain-containing OB-fold protein [Anaerolineae bacterium]